MQSDESMIWVLATNTPHPILIRARDFDFLLHTRLSQEQVDKLKKPLPSDGLAVRWENGRPLTAA